MKNRVIKKTQDEVSPIGFGAMRLPTKNGKIDRKKAQKIVYHAIDNGINFIDTAAIYGNGDSEKFLGEILQGEYKDKVLISTKLPAYKVKKYEHMESMLNKQLERLQRDSIDYYLLHNIDLKSMNRLLKINVLGFLSKAKREGKIKHVGFSYHGKTEEFPLLIDIYDWDCVMVQYNYVDDNTQASKEGIKYAADKGIGVFVMEPLKGGIIAGKMPEKAEQIFKAKNPSKTNAQWSFEWLLNHETISCVFSGMNSIEQVDENIATANKIKPGSIANEDIEVYSQVKEVIQELLKINCAGCGYCMPCPMKINIPGCIKLYNEKYLFNQKGIIPPSQIDYYSNVGGIMNEPANAGLCNGCGKCVKNCPQHLNIPYELSKVRKEFEGHGFLLKVLFIKYIGMPIYQRL